ncbi:RagB/SusD family nutrient uptake outer membrane protein [Leptobacterium flavescens]|uniref:RagB/SusD family nutrient uptake outer membrane protein n=1 Tax=Leptobacterium flavescens TaxID=472055 RepID=A0A6P0URP7_9FLAO|nr:RagB/SusD family nutrient uptake outer membrane protein [Leptobacterium flavescens]NER14648.1 RagB/SusD family nutrient uptake outer membrane protein [Leptobacterium flavescens]
MKSRFKKLALVLMTGAVTSAGLVSCEGELDLEPIVEQTSASLFEDTDSYRQFIARVYAGISVSGQQGPAGNPDISGIDEGFSNYLRQFWKHQELTTDEAIIAWNDGTIHDLNNHVWTASNEFIRAMYDRIYFQIALTNEFIRQSSESQLDARNINGADRDEIRAYRAEARFMRALSYWHAIDMYANVPFVLDDQDPGAFLPRQASRQEVFDFLVAELQEVAPLMVEARLNEYGRADRGAAWMLLAKLYLNAEVYTGEAMYTEAIGTLNNVINAGYSLHDSYDELFLADNDSNGAQNETIFPITFDGLNTQGFGGMTFLLHAPVGGNQNPADFGINGGWFGIRTTNVFVSRFADITGNTDDRANFFTDGQTLEITDAFNFSEGYLVEKFSNLTSAGEPGSDPSGNFGDADFAMFRLADAYLMYAEAVLRGGNGGDTGTALNLVNQIRERAYGDTSGNISAGELTLDFILDERSRELHWEGHRRTDLIRFGQFTDLVWPFKGGVQTGSPSEAFRNIYPIPSTDLIANPNLNQNTGY